MREERIARLVFVWVLIAQAFLLLPHMLRTPLLIIPVWLVCTLWRLMIFKGRSAYPPTWIKAIFVVASFAMVVLLERKLFSIEAMVLVLIIAFMLKLLELRQQRDLLISVYLAYFVIATELLFNQSIISAAYLLVSLWLVTSTLVAANSGTAVQAFSYPSKVAAKMLAFSLPLMVAAFLVFPRLDPLWTLPSPSENAQTGMTDSLSPGTISNLAESDELAFRVEFEGTIPAMADLYWRGLALTEFDGVQWRQARQRMPVAIEKHYTLDADSASYAYRMIMEASNRPWMFPLDGLIAYDADADFLEDYSLRHQGRIHQRSAWQMESVPSAHKTAELSTQQQQHLVFLPEGLNPKMHALAQAIKRQSSDQFDYINRVLQFFTEEKFYYTLTPPLAGEHATDHFLFQSRRGFCEHYANAFVMLMRAAGIPARIIVGYQGGDINPYEQYVSVRQLDAHAWAEVWLGKAGWVRIDPTYAIAPERIEQGSQQSLRQDPRFLAQSPLSAVRSEFGWVKKLQYRMDQVNFLWHTTVLSYQGARQENVLKALLGQVTLSRVIAFVGGVFLFSALLIGTVFYLQHPKAKLSAEQHFYNRFLKKLARKGLHKPVGVAAGDFAVIAGQYFPHQAQAIQEISEQYQRLRYSLMTEQQYRDLLSAFKANINRLSVRLEKRSNVHNDRGKA